MMDMKTLLKFLLVIIFSFFIINNLSAQSTRKERIAKKIHVIKKMIDDTNYVFIANTANPMRGGQKMLTSEYDFIVKKDSIKSYLPYYGTSYSAPNDPTDNEGGIKFTSTKFSYKVKQAKNGGWDIEIKPNDGNVINWRNVQSINLSISPEGYASLNVNSSNRDPITFSGEIISR